MAKRQNDIVKPMYLEKEPWERLDGESEQAFRAFNVFLDLPTGERSIRVARKRLEKESGYERTMSGWQYKWQWRSRCQAYDAAQIEKMRDEAERAKLTIYRDGLTLGRFFYRNVGIDLQNQFNGFIENKAGEQVPYEQGKTNRFTVAEKVRLMTWGLHAAERYAEAEKEVLMDKGASELRESSYDEAFAEVLRSSPELHDAYNEILSRALRRARERKKVVEM